MSTICIRATHTGDGSFASSIRDTEGNKIQSVFNPEILVALWLYHVHHYGYDTLLTIRFGLFVCQVYLRHTRARLGIGARRRDTRVEEVDVTNL